MEHLQNAWLQRERPKPAKVKASGSFLDLVISEASKWLRHPKLKIPTTI